MARPTINRVLAVATVTAWCAVSLTYGLLLSIVGPTAEILAGRTQSSPSDLAPVLGMGGICTLIGALPSGWVLDRLPGHMVLAAVLVIQAGGYLLMPHCTTILWLTVVYATVSFSFNFINTGLNVMVIWSYEDPQDMALVLNTVSAVFGFGGILAPQLVTLGTQLGDGTLSYVWTAAAALVCAVLLLLLPSPKPRLRHTGAAARSSHLDKSDSADSHRQQTDSSSNGRHNGAEQAARATGGSEYQSSLRGHLGSSQQSVSDPRCSDPESDIAAVAPGGTARGSSARAQHHSRPWSVLIPALLTVFANVSIELGYAAWIYTYSREVGGLGEAQAENMTSLFWLLFVIGRGVAAVLATCVAPATLLLTSMPLAILGSILPLLHPGPSATVTSVLLVGLGSACGFPSTLSIAAQWADLDGYMNGIISTVAGLSMTVMPSLVPRLAKVVPSIGFTSLMLATLVMGVGQLAALLWLLRAGAAHAAQHRHTTAPAEYSDSEGDLQAPLLVASDTVEG